MKISVKGLLIASSLLLFTIGKRLLLGRGVLDDRYCDENQDLVAGIHQRIQMSGMIPSTLVFTHTPVEESSVIQRRLPTSKLNGKLQVSEWFTGTVHSNPAQVEAMRSGWLHVAGFLYWSDRLRAVNSRVTFLSQWKARRVWLPRLQPNHDCKCKDSGINKNVRSGKRGRKGCTHFAFFQPWQPSSSCVILQRKA